MAKAMRIKDYGKVAATDWCLFHLPPPQKHIAGILVCDLPNTRVK